MCHSPVNPLYIHHPSYRSHLLCSRSTAQARERVWLPKLLLLTELTPARSAALGEHTNSIISAGRRPFSLSLSLSLSLCHSATKVLQAWSPPNPLYRDATCPNSWMHSIKAFPLEIFIYLENHIWIFWREKKSNKIEVQIFNSFSFYWISNWTMMNPGIFRTLYFTSYRLCPRAF